MIQVAIAGIDSELGEAVACQVEQHPEMQLTGGTTMAEHHTGATARLTSILDGSHVLVDVTSPAEMMRNALACLPAGCALVGGAGRLDPNHVEELREFSRRIPIFYSPNLCIETAAVMRVLPLLQQTMPYLDTDLTGVDPYRRRLPVGNGDDLPSEPVVFLTGGGQEIMLSQKVYGHEAPARGAIRAIDLLTRHDSGFFTMDDLLNGASTGIVAPELARVR